MVAKKKARIADTAFKTGQDGTLATPDIYGTPPQSPVGATTSVTSAGGSLDLGKLMGIPSTGPLTGASNVLAAGTVAKIQNMTDVIGVVMGEMAGNETLSMDTLKNISPDTVGKLANAMGYPQVTNILNNTKKVDYTNPQFLDNLAKSNPYAKVLIDGTNTLIKGKDIKNVDDLLKIAGEFTGNTELASMVNISKEMAFAKVVIDSANSLGIPALGKKILDNYEDKKEKRQLELNTANSLAQGTNLNELGTLVDTYGSDSVLFVNSEIIKTLLANYQKPTSIDHSVKPKDTATLLSELKLSLEKLDKNWKFTKRGNISVFNTEVFSVLSDDAYDLFLTDKDLVIPTVMAKQLQVSDLNSDPISLLQRQYPYAPLLA